MRSSKIAQLWQDNASLLRQLQHTLATLEPATFTYRAEATLGGSIGAHLRHVLEFYQTFISGCSEGIINYDGRAREEALETCLPTALKRIEKVLHCLERSEHELPQSQLPVKVLENAADTPENWTLSSVGRELSFLLSHTVHHQALIALLLIQQGEPTSADFGVAPSTLRYRASLQTS
jgi:uncharacterized damage-inducible protein DinB